MKSVAVLALTLWTISSPALAAFRTSCTDDAFCTDTDNGGFANAVCVTAGADCVCSAAYKANAEDATACVAKGLTDTCVADADCAGVANAACEGLVCVCSGAYKNNANNDGCVAKGLTDACAADTDCAGVTNSKCTSLTCSCDTKYVTSGAMCTKLSDITCVGDGDCPSGGGYTCTAPKCECSTNYGLKDEVCVQDLTKTICTAAGSECPENAECVTLKCQCKSGFKQNVNTCDSNGARGMAVNIGLLCGILVMLSYMNT